MSSSEELIELVRRLKRERSFVYTEQKRIREQYTQVSHRRNHFLSHNHLVFSYLNLQNQFNIVNG